MDTPTTEFFIEKSGMPVSLMLVGGEQMSGILFVQASARNLSALEDAPEFMNSSEPFFPLRRTDGHTLLVSKDHVLAVDVPQEFTAKGWTYGGRARVEVIMQGGATHHGELHLEQSVGQPRVLDHMNRRGEPFVVLQRDDGVTLLNRHHIAYVRPLDDAAA